MNMKENILVLFNELSEETKAKFQQLCEENDYSIRFFTKKADMQPYLGEATIIHGSGADLVTGAPKLKWFSSASAGVNHYFKPGVLRDDMVLTNSAGAYGLSISEHMIMVALMLLRRMPEYYELVSERTWKNSLPQRSLYGSRITVLGTGDIGSNFAKRVRVFEPASLTGVNRSGRAVEGFDKCVKISELDSLLPETDLLFMAVPETKETINLLNAERLALLPETSYVINVGRGTAIDEAAIKDALENDRLAGAALDVFVTEPLPADSPLYGTKNLIITPHCSGQTTLAYTRVRNIQMFYENLCHYAKGEPLEHVVDRDRQY